MTTLRQAVQDYLRMRRNLGFKLRNAGKGLLDFANFMDQHHATYITQALALDWAKQPLHAQAAHWAQRLSFVEDLRSIAARPIHARRFQRRACCPLGRNTRDRICTRIRKFVDS